MLQMARQCASELHCAIATEPMSARVLAAEDHKVGGSMCQPDLRDDEDTGDHEDEAGDQR